MLISELKTVEWMSKKRLRLVVFTSRILQNFLTGWIWIWIWMVKLNKGSNLISPHCTSGCLLKKECTVVLSRYWKTSKYSIFANEPHKSSINPQGWQFFCKMKDVQPVLLVSKEKSYSLKSSEINSFWWVKLGGGRSLVHFRYVSLYFYSEMISVKNIWKVNNFRANLIFAYWKTFLFQTNWWRISPLSPHSPSIAIRCASRPMKGSPNIQCTNMYFRN